MISLEDIQRTAHLSSREAAKELGVGKTSVNKYRNQYKSVSVNGDTLEEAFNKLKDHDVDLTKHKMAYSVTEREMADTSVRRTYTLRATPDAQKADLGDDFIDADELIDIINSHVVAPPAKRGTGRTLVVCAADFQVGKVSYHGGTPELVERIQDSFDKSAARAAKGNYDEIVIADLGDIIENFFSVSSQRETNDVDLTGQVRIARRLFLYGIMTLAPHASKITVVSVPSNHGAVRIDFKSPAGNSHNDWGIEISYQLEDALRVNTSYDHVQFVRPEPLFESVAHLTSDGTELGFVHGHQAKSPDKIGDWWRNQDHGRQPTANSDILLAGHYHSLRVYQSGNGRWVIVCPASDNGSDWFTNTTGESSIGGMLVFEVGSGMWYEMEIL